MIEEAKLVLFSENDGGDIKTLIGDKNSFVFGKSGNLVALKVFTEQL